jgi:uncharacterized membrane protein required for colicin V production
MFIGFIIYLIGCVIAFGFAYTLYRKDREEMQNNKKKYNPETGYVYIATFCSWLTVGLILFNYIKYKE